MTKATLNVIDYYIQNDFCRGGNGENEDELWAERALVAAAPKMRMALDSMVLNFAQSGRVTDEFVRDVARMLLEIDA
jgi:hypothetical protein